MPWTNNGHYIPSGSAPLDVEKSESGGREESEPSRSAELDLRDVPSPVNLLRANGLLRSLGSGEQVAVLTTNSAQCILEFKLLAAHTGHSIISESEDHQGYWFLFHRN